MYKNIVIVSIIIISGLCGYSQFEVGAVIRPRSEFRNGYSQLRDSVSYAAFFVSQRTRLYFDYKKDKLKTRITFYDFRVWGDQPLKKDFASIGLFEAWAEAEISETFSVRFGRQPLKYDNARLISPVNWNQIGASHDAVLLKYRNSGWDIDFGSAFNQTAQLLAGTDYSELITNYKILNFIWARKKWGKTELAFQGIADGYQKENNPNAIYMRYTEGLIVKYNYSGLNVAARAFYQGGKNQAGKNISAFFLNAEAIFCLSEKLKLTGGFELMSGNDIPDSLSTTDKAFNILYGGRHKFNGYMNYFTVPITTNGAGLINPYLKIDFEINKSIRLQAAYHYFSIYGTYIHDNLQVDKSLGQEIDLTAQFKLMEHMSLLAGYSTFFATETTGYIKGGDNSLLNHWAFVMITVNPVFFVKL